MKTKTKNPFFNILICIFYVILPSSTYSLRYILEFPLYILISLQIKKLPGIFICILIFYVIFTFFIQSIYSCQLSDLLELSRLSSILFFYYLLKHFSLYHKLIVYKIIFMINLVALLYNFYDNGYLLQNLSFNNKNLTENHGRNSGIFSFITTSGFFSLSFLFVIYFNKSKNYFIKTIYITLSLFCILLSGSKTLYLVSFLVCFILFIKELFNCLFKSKKLESCTFIILSPSVILFVLYLKSLNFNIFYQFTKLTHFFSTGKMSSLESRYELWWSYFNLQSDNLFYFLCGTPKSVLKILNSTFDSDYVWLFTRFGLISLSFYLLLITLFLYSKKSKLTFKFLLYISAYLSTALTIGIIPDSQSILIFLFTISILFYNKNTSYKYCC